MSYQVIARKYRPQRFSDVVGQEHVTTTLSNAIEQGRIAHAFLFCGPRGTGKTTIARIFAKCLNCTDGPRVQFPEDDPRCLEIAEGRSMDVLEIDGASNNGVEQVRELRETVKYAPASSRFKIYIIDEVHMLSTAAFNALLKTLEEPPAHVKFMFATTEPEKVLATILSRCQRFDLRRIPMSLIVKHIAYIAKQEKVEVDDNALHAIARGADGCMRDAESTLDQLISFCGGHIVESDVLSMFGLTARSQLAELAQALLEGQAHAALRGLNDLAASGKELGRLLSDLLNHFRNILLFQVSTGNLDLLEVSDTEAETLGAQAKLAEPAAVSRIMEVFTDAEMRFRDSASRKTLLEVTLMKAIEARNAVSLDAVLQALNSLRSNACAPEPITGGQPMEAQPRSNPSLDPLPPMESKKSAARPSQALAADPELESVWKQLLDSLERSSRFTHTCLVQAHPVSLTQTQITIGYDPEFEDQMGLADNSRTHELLRTKLGELGHPVTTVRFVKAEVTRPPSPPIAESIAQKEAPAAPKAPTQVPSRKITVPKKDRGASPAAPPAFDKEDFKNDPLIQKALEVFKGQIVDVRN
ncbi:MAG: DNA polymerase III subunit gamma/tau [Verrucomicrobia bacterium]|jgi:DNA polymerase-3 subunit gamma/tau|nr:DNA polymerase III subunit gamma/tau [Verrucomicrobiota bacterium]